LREKRILITKIIADKHEEVLAGGGAERAFIATGTWMPLDHSRDHEVELQGCDEYKYAEVCKAEHIATRQAKLAETAAAVAAARVAVEAKLAAVEAAEAKQDDELDQKFRGTAALIFPLIQPRLERDTKDTFAAIAQHVQRSFVCYGSYLPYVMATCVAELRVKSQQLPCAVLPHDDIDVACGPFSDSLLFTKQCDKVDLNVGKPVNLVQFSQLNAKLLLVSADINAVAMVAEVLVDRKAVTKVTWHVGPSLWEFLDNKRLVIPRTKNAAQSAVRLVYKAWKNNLSFDLGMHNFEEGILYASHVAKVCSAPLLGWIGVAGCFVCASGH
jgi:hypothetical protein